MSSDKIDALRELLGSFGSCLVAYSGGVDSTFLARMAHEVLQDRALAVIADSPSLPRRELEAALDLAAQVGFPVRVIRTREFENPHYLANPSNRCYFCKHELFSELVPIARKEGFAVIVYGENSSDLGDFRPGSQAALEFQVRAPLRELGFSKEEIRAWSARFGLPTAEKPQMACLSSRIPHGEPVTPEKLSMIEAAENVLRDLGFFDVRVRHHELISATPMVSGESGPSVQPVVTAPAGNPGRYLARVEVGPGEMRRFWDKDCFLVVSKRLKQIGYAFVTLDLQGYRRGGGVDLGAWGNEPRTSATALGSSSS